jgi:hypothetical protein
VHMTTSNILSKFFQDEVGRLSKTNEMIAKTAFKLNKMKAKQDKKSSSVAYGDNGYEKISRSN